MPAELLIKLLMKFLLFASSSSRLRCSSAARRAASSCLHAAVNLIALEKFSKHICGGLHEYYCLKRHNGASPIVSGRRYGCYFGETRNRSTQGAATRGRTSSAGTKLRMRKLSSRQNSSGPGVVQTSASAVHGSTQARAASCGHVESSSYLFLSSSSLRFRSSSFLLSASLSSSCRFRSSASASAAR